MKTVAILCAAKNSIYHSLPGVEVFDKRRDAKTYCADSAVVAHPPCRAWSNFTRHQAKPEAGEKELGPFCVEQVKRCGGILEHPAHSHLFSYCSLPLPGVRWMQTEQLWSMEVWQAWWGHPMLKKTWLLFSRISPRDVQCPLKLHPHGADRRCFQLLSKANRSATPPLFAQWLVELARTI